MTATQKRWGWIVVAAVVGAILLAGLIGREPAPQVTVARAMRERLEAAVSSNGKVEPIVPYSLRAQVSTFVASVSAVEGQAIRAGDVILQLDSAEATSEVARLRHELLAAQEQLRAGRAGGPATEVAQTESDLRKAEAIAAQATRERGALERLLAKQAATQSEVDANKLALDKAQNDLRAWQQKKAELTRQAALDAQRGSLEVERVQAALRVAEENLRSTRLTAPVTGTLYSLPARAGQYVRVGDLLAEVADLTRVRVRAFVDEPELAGIEQGQEVEITWDAMSSRAWKGRTEQVPKAVVARGTRSVGEVICSVENAKLELLPNTNINVRVRIRERADALVVPRSAVRSDGAERYVFVVEGSTLRKRSVKVGIAGATKYEILEGIKDGDRVALPGETELRDGLAIRVVEQK